MWGHSYVIGIVLPETQPISLAEELPSREFTLDDPIYCI